jgi:dihydroorotate dehydrogenase (fumarate)
MDLSTSYMGLRLRNPVIAASSGLTATLEGVVECRDHGAAAVVLKSLFEEQLTLKYQPAAAHKELNEVSYPEPLDYVSRHSREKAIEEYLDMIRKCKQSVDIPVIASINCISMAEWTHFAVDIANAGADGLELNLSILPSDTNKSCIQNEEMYLDIINEVIKWVTIPIAIKISPYFSGLAKSALRFSFTGIKGIVLFNRYFSPDIDIDEQKLTPGWLYSSPEEIRLPLRWIAMLSERITCDIAASTGVHDGEGLVKVLLTGAHAAQVCSTLYLNGMGRIGEMLDFLEKYMTRHGAASLQDIRGKMSMRKTENPAAFERIQFMKYFSEME